MNKKTKLIFALSQVDGITKLIQGMDYEDYMMFKLIPLKVELKRQLSLEEHVETLV